MEHPGRSALAGALPAKHEEQQDENCRDDEEDVGGHETSEYGSFELLCERGPSFKPGPRLSFWTGPASRYRRTARRPPTIVSRARRERRTCRPFLRRERVACRSQTASSPRSTPWPATADAGASVGALLEKGQKSVTIETIVAEVRHPMLALRTQIGMFPAPETGGDVGAADAGLPPVFGRAVAT